MCFSASASFTVAAATAVIGIATIRQIKKPRDTLLAITPFLFALQQTIEGLLWVQLSNDGSSESIDALSFGFQLFAEVLWPVFTPLAVFLIETDIRRRRILAGISVIGALLSVNLLFGLISNPPFAAINNHSIDYAREVTTLKWQMFPYFLCTFGALALSSHRIMQIFAVVILVGFVVSAYAYLATFISVWCFFTAAASTLIYFYFKRAVVKDVEVIDMS